MINFKKSIQIRLILMFLLVLVLVSGSIIFVVNHYYQVLKENTRSNDLSEQIIQTSLSIQVHFKKQVQEWKNILLRGHIHDDYEKYLQQFMNEIHHTQKDTKHLLTLLKDDPPLLQMAKQFFIIHNQLTQQYTQALEKVNLTEKNSYRIIDRHVRGIDRAPIDLLNNLVNEVTKSQAENKAHIKQHLIEDFFMFSFILIALLIVSLTLISWISTRLVIKPLLRAINVASRIAGKDSNIYVDNKKQNELEQLFETLEVAETAVQAKNEFLANMSHEIRTPLNAILGFIDLLKEKTQDEESQKYLDTIDSSSHILLGIINDVLDFSKIDSGKLTIESVAFKPLKEFNSLTDLFKARCSEKNILLNIKINEQLPPGIYTDLLKLKQIISNLLSNAIKFTEPNKQISVTIDYSQGWLNCAVQDEGIGISTEAQKHIFDAFMQAETSTTRKYGGTGLGLAISSRLVEALGGELKLESELNKGSRFYFSIPVQLADIGEEGSAQTEPDEFFHGHILLVEDNKVNQMLMSAILKKKQLSFDIAADGLEAVSAFQAVSYDLILMDENMPNLNGIEATKQIRALEQKEGNSHVPIIALTANAMKGDRERFLQSGMDEYLTKPINKTKLSEVFANFLN